MIVTSRFINPFTDYGFKRLFGTEANKDLLVDFLNQLLPQKHQIVELRYARNEYAGTNELDRKAVFDLYCLNQHGDRFIVELQKARQVYFKDRSVFYSSFPIQEQGQVGNWNFRLASVYTVAVLDFILTDSPDVITTVQLKDQRNDVFYDKLTYIYMEMPKFTKTEDELETQSDKWMYLFKHLPDLQERPEQLQERIFHRLFEAAEVANFDRAERDRYEQSLKSYRDLKNVLSFAEMDGIERGLEQGIAEGIERGIAKGIERGLAEGIERGLAEGVERGIAEGVERGIAEGVERGIAEGVERGIAEGVERGIAEGVERGIAEGVERGIAEGVERGIAEGVERGIVEGVEKGLEQGRKRGLAEGVEKGLAEGVEKGSNQAIARVVQNALAKGFTVAEVANLVGLPEEDISKFINK